ncbi:MAG: retron system putative HNH endonuclease [Mariprofundaceae bacterium]|nr:retron system putative HNH endonuclease [Mariprofundaceae bacterium]
MRKISKGSEPKLLTAWKKANPTGTYQELSHQVRKHVRQVNIDEQFGLCAYCCQRIDASNSMNEHVEAKAIAPNRGLDFSNIVASCTTPNQCDRAHQSKPLPLTPLMDACETELKFYLAGRVKGLSPRASTSIDVLNLNSKRLINCREQAVDALLYGGGSNPEEIELLEDELIEILLEDFKEVGKDHLLAPYSPVLVSILGGIRKKLTPDKKLQE